MKWVWQIAAKKVLRSGIQAAISAIGAERLASGGVTLDPILLTASLYGGLELVRNWLKVRWGVKFL